MKSKIVRFELSLLIALVLSVAFGTVSFSVKCDSIRNKVLRMHVIANSDTDADQELKLKVRDAVLEKGKELFDGSITRDDAIEKITPYIDELTNTAKKVIVDNGYDYDVKITVADEHFNTRVYENSITLPAGEYRAVKVIIGEGKGHNWWCVMFPPMCLPSATEDCELKDVLNDSEMNLVENGDKLKFKFKIVEIYENFVTKLN